VGEPIVGDQAGRALERRFPALDPEPPPRSWRWKGLVTVAVLAGAALVSALILLVVGSGSGSHSSGATGGIAEPGTVVYANATGQIVESYPDGTHPSPRPSLGNVRQLPFASTSPDRRFLITGTGTVLSIHGTNLAVDHTKLRLGEALQLAFPDAFSDHDEAVVVQQAATAGSTTSTSQSWAIPLGTGGPVSLGRADGVAGDPQEMGAFVSVARPGPQPSTASTNPPPDIEVQLRDVGKPPVTLATAAALNTDLHESANTPVNLFPYPSPEGDDVAIAVVAVNNSGSAGLVVLDRTGHLVDETAVFVGPNQGLEATWSPNGASLTYIDSGDSGLDVNIWTPTGSASSRLIPFSLQYVGSCQWSSDGEWILCEAGSDQGPAWIIAQVDGAALANLAAPGELLAWIGK